MALNICHKLFRTPFVLFFVVSLWLFYLCNFVIFLSLLASNASCCCCTSRMQTWACKTAHQRENNEHWVCRNSWEWQAPASGLYHGKWREVDSSYQRASPFCWPLHYKIKKGKILMGGGGASGRGREKEGEAVFEMTWRDGVLSLMGTNSKNL